MVKPFRVRAKPPATTIPSTFLSATKRMRLCSQLLCAHHGGRRQLPYLLWSLAYFGSIVTLMAYESMQFSRNRLEKFMYNVGFGLSALIFVLMTVGTMSFQRRHFAEMSAEIDDIDRCLQRIDGGIVEVAAGRIADDYAELGRFANRWLVAIAVVSAIAVSVDVPYNDWHAVDWLRSCAVYVLPNATISLNLLRYVVALRLLAVKYASVNRLLWQQKRSCEANAKAVAATATTQPGGHLVASCWETTLNATRRVHFQLNRLNDGLTAAFGLTLCAVFVLTLLVMTTQLFTFYKRADWTQPEDGSGFPVADVYLLVYGFVWMVMFSCRMMMVLVFSDRLYREKRKVVAILYRLDLAGDDDADDEDDDDFVVADHQKVGEHTLVWPIMLPGVELCVSICT